MSPADQPQAVAPRRSTDPPALWVSLALGSVLIHLVLFILVSVVFTRHAKVQLDLEPVAVEFVDPNTATVQARSAAPNRAIAARPGAPSTSIPSSAQAQLNAPRSQPSTFNPPIEQPFVSPSPIPQPARPSRLPARTQPQFNPFNNLPQQPIPTPTPSQPNQRSQRPNLTNLPERQSLPSNNSPQGSLPGAAQNLPNSTTPLPAVSQPPVEGERIAQAPQGESVAVTVSNPRQPSVDVLRQPAQPIGFQKIVSIRYPAALARQTIRLQASLLIGSNGLVLDVGKPTLRSSSAIDPETLNDLVRQIFTQWQFEPAHDNLNGKLLTPPQSNLTIDAEVQLP